MNRLPRAISAAFAACACLAPALTPAQTFLSTQKSPEEFMAKIRRELALIGGIVKRANLQPTD